MAQPDDRGVPFFSNLCPQGFTYSGQSGPAFIILVHDVGFGIVGLKPIRSLLP